MQGNDYEDINIPADKLFISEVVPTNPIVVTIKLAAEALQAIRYVLKS